MDGSRNIRDTIQAGKENIQRPTGKSERSLTKLTEKLSSTEAHKLPKRGKHQIMTV